MKERNRSVLFVFLASVCFSTGGLFIKLIPWNALAINGARNLIGALVIGSYLLITRRRIVFSRRVLIGALSMIGVTTFFVLANKMTTAANTIVLQFTAPVFVIIFMTVLYRQKPGKADLAEHLYEVLRDFDRVSPELIIAMGVDEKGLGLAVMNRLRKAAGYQILQAEEGGITVKNGSGFPEFLFS